MNPLPKDIEKEFDERFDCGCDSCRAEQKPWLAEKLSAEYQRGRNDAVEYINQRVVNLHTLKSFGDLIENWDLILNAARTTEGKLT